MIVKEWMRTLALAGTALMLLVSVPGCGEEKNLEAGDAWEITETTNLQKLFIAEGAAVTAPEGCSVTMTVDGVETGIAPGRYEGEIVLTRTEANVVPYKEFTHTFRQALYLDETGVVADKSVPAAVAGPVSSGSLKDLRITSVGECFNGIFAAGGVHTVENLSIDFTGNGCNDFAGYGAAVMSTGEDTVLVVDGAEINTRGAIRTALVADGGSRLIVKNASILTRNGTLPGDYVPTVALGMMKEAPWMLGISGNCRATNLLGQNTSAAYIHSMIAAEGWGVLSTDDCQDVTLTAINSDIVITGDSGYGAFSIGNATERFLGCTFEVADFVMNLVNGSVRFDDSTSDAVQTLNVDLGLGLTDEELAALETRHTQVRSGRFGILCGNGTLEIGGGTTFECGKTVFLIKDASADIRVDGARGARLHAGNGILLQLMDSDDPGAGPDMTIADQTYTDPVGDPEKDPSHDTTAVDEDTDAVAVFSNISLAGDFYNSTRGAGGGDGSPDLPAAAPDTAGDTGDAPFIMPGMKPPSSKNLVLTFNHAAVTGVISASTARHARETITASDYRLIGEVVNTPTPAVNNGVIVSLEDSTWTVTGTSYLTRLTIGEGSNLAAPEGNGLTLTVDGAEQAIEAGTYMGNIVLMVTNG